MLDLISIVMPYLEAASYAATIVLVFGLVLARVQLIAFYKDSKIRNERLAKEKAIEASLRYLSEYVKICNFESSKRDNAGIEKYTGQIGNFTKQSLGRHDVENVIKEARVNDFCVPALNELEVISSYFVTGVADESTGFGIIGRSYCHSVRLSYAKISFARDDDQAQPYWKNIVSLYQIWSVRLTRQELENSSDKLSRQISGMPKDRPIPPIGS